jgi:hypothetical protein
MKYDENVLGVCLIQCTGTTAGFMETMKDKVTQINGSQFLSSEE